MVLYCRLLSDTVALLHRSLVFGKGNLHTSCKSHSVELNRSAFFALD